MTRPTSKQLIVFGVTFLSYALYHVGRKTLAGVKQSIMKDWLSNATHAPLFESETAAQAFLGTLDAVFMGAYAAALFFWGWLGDRLNPKIVLVVGMIASTITMIAFGFLPVKLNFYSTPYFVIVYVLFGVAQACGFPAHIAIMAAWWGSAQRGLVMGAWAACQPAGNILSSLTTSWFLALGYEYAFLLNGLLMVLGAIMVTFSITARPEASAESDEENEETIGLHEASEESHSMKPVGFLEAIVLPGVFAYCVCNACLKLVNYAFFFWLPLYFTSAYGWPESKADQLAGFYDVGGVLGSVIGGIVSDRMGFRAPLIVSMIGCSLIALFLYAHIGPSMALNTLGMLVVGATVSGPYNLIVGAVAVDLGSQPALAGNAMAMSTVSGLVDGTGSIGSALGQLAIPLVQNAAGWRAVFYLFIILNAIGGLCIAPRGIADSFSWWRRRRDAVLPGETDRLLPEDDNQ